MSATVQTEAEVSATASGDLGLSLIRHDTTDTFAGVEARATPTLTARYVLRRLIRRAVRACVRTFRRVRAAAVRSDVAVTAYVARLRKAVNYRPRHAAARSWYGVQRSTSRRNAARVVASRAAAKEGELPGSPYADEYLSWLASFAETLRAEQHALHEPTGRHFICS